LPTRHLPRKTFAQKTSASGQMSFWAIVFLCKCLSGQTALWANVFWANVFLGKCLLGKCPSGQTSSGQMFFWANVFLGKCCLGKCHHGQTSYGQMSLGKCCMGQCHGTVKKCFHGLRQTAEGKKKSLQFGIIKMYLVVMSSLYNSSPWVNGLADAITRLMASYCVATFPGA
jgi:hypothetical protein